MNKYYYCYSPFLHEFLKAEGIRYITTSRNIKNKNVFWLYQQSNELSKALNEYSKMRKGFAEG
ncbi:DUF5659 domain-containing protein [Enterococcus italicus]|uniref:DUF5659 domain-containing protein n=1 Tax=Enterococcus italicus TaxID=246144 RepID=UPI003F45B424